MENQFNSNSPSAIIQPLYIEKGWIKFLAIFSIVTGVLYCISIFWAIIGWLPIWGGIIMLDAVKSLELGYTTGNEAEMLSSTEKLAKSLKITGIFGVVLIALTIIFTTLYLLFIIFIVGMGVVAGARS